MNATTMLNGVFGRDSVIQRFRRANKTKRESSQSERCDWMRIHAANPEFTIYVVLWARNYQKSQAHDFSTNSPAFQIDGISKRDRSDNQGQLALRRSFSKECSRVAPTLLKNAAC
jgi:hypothetical protein